MVEDNEFGIELYQWCFVGSQLIIGVVDMTKKGCGSFSALVEPVFVDVLGGCHSFSYIVGKYIIKFSVV